MGNLSASEPLSRREFLRAGGLCLLGAVFPQEISQAAAQFSISNGTYTTDLQAGEGQLGRVLEPSMQLRDRPSALANPGKTVWKDLVYPITEVTVGDTSIPYNRIWYRLGEA